MPRPVFYFDANSTTPTDPRVWEAMRRVSETAYGNPGSSHQIGRKARQALEDARESIARILDASPKELIFTSGATESTNLALLGMAAAVPIEKRTLAISAGEHPATSETAERLQKQGWRIISIPLDPAGRMIPDAIEDLPWSELGLLAVLYANNETGVIQDLARIRELCSEHQTPWHVDVTQAVGRIAVSLRTIGATAASFGVHKCHGPRGIGGLVLTEGVPFVPEMVGGFQELSRRPGTEAVALAAGMATALEIWQAQQDEYTDHVCSLRDRFEQQLTELAAPLVINGQQADRLPNTSNITFPGVEGEALLIALDLEGICCSLGSACASGSVEPSPVLLAMGIETEAAKSSMRFSLHRELTEDEIDEACRRIAAAVNRLRN